MEHVQKIEYITDKEGNKKVVLPVQTYEDMLEDIQGLVAIAEHKDEKTIPIDEVKKNLKTDCLL